MNIDFIILLSIILFFASLIHGSVGFGFPMIATPLLALFTDIQTAIIYTLIPTLLVNLVSIMSEGKLLLALKKFWPLAVLAMIGCAIGTQILIWSNSEIFKLLLASVILFYLFIDKIKIELSWIKNNPKFSLIFFGTTAGILGGLTNVMAPILIIYSLESKQTKSELIQASNLCFLFGKIAQIIIFTLSSKFSFEAFQGSSLMLFVILIALIIGVKIKRKINAGLYKNIIKLILFIISMTLFGQVI